MEKRKFLILMCLVLALITLSWGLEQGAVAAPLINGTPHYFSHPNYANSPLPASTLPVTPTAVGNPLVDRAYATDFPAPPDNVFVLVPTALPAGTLTSFQTRNQALAGGSPTPSAGKTFRAYVLRPITTNQYLVVFDSGELTVPALADPAVSDNAIFPANVAVQAGDVLAFFGMGVPVDTGAGADTLCYPAFTPPLQGSTITPGDATYPIYPQARTYSFGAVVDVTGTTPVISGGIRKFVDGLPGIPGVTPFGANNLGQALTLANPDNVTYPGSDYYEIAVVQYQEKMHSDLPPTMLRGYVQLNNGTDPNCTANPPDASCNTIAPAPVHYLGPSIVAMKDRPVRILFRNLLPAGAGGNLFIPVDTTVMGSGMTPDGHEWMAANPGMVDPLKPMCSDPMKADMVASGHCYAENRATLHLHGGLSPWISDGTPHQWTTPADQITPYPDGVSVHNVPDMLDPGPGALTFFYTNQQSAKLMFYHDHAWGITRLNVYAGEAAGYVLTDATEQTLMAQGGALEGLGIGIPLVVQDKTFVPDDAQLALQDETWDTARWGGLGSLWMPHVYSPAQNPGDSTGVNQFGRWAYGPWFWPPTTGIAHGPIANPYYDLNCNPDLQWCEPPEIPGTPFLSMGMEAFNDTPIVNGTVYPTVTVEPKSYRFRILSAANDRFFNLHFYRAVDANGVPCDNNNLNPAPESTGIACTEVALNPAEVAAALIDPAGNFPTPLAGTEGPSWIQIGTEGGFLPAPVVIPPQPITWVTDPTVFNAGNVDQHSLLLGPAERADVIVDFSQFAGQTLILYNDAPAAFPARDPRYDYYTGNPDLRDTGGAPSTLPGYGPNTRTVMQVKVAGTPSPAFDLNALNAAFAHQVVNGNPVGVFESSQDPIIVGQGPYNSAYGTTFQNNGPNAGLVQIFNTSFSFKTLLGGAGGASLTMPIRPKQIQDEMGEAFDMEYGRMSGFLGLEKPGANAGVQNMILYPYVNPASEILDGIELPPGVSVTPIASADDGTQIWKITHNGVDTHPIHWHLANVQLINRVGWDGIIRKPDLNELGWKDTVRISPLEDTIIAIRPILPKLPFGVMDSMRPLNPMMPLGSTAMFNPTDANGDPIPGGIVNDIVNFGWEYVWHCHILSHEEMDMMRPMIVNVARALPFAPVLTAVQANSVDLSWTDGTPVNYQDVLSWGDPAAEVGFRIERATGNNPFDNLAFVPANVTTYPDATDVPGTPYRYRVVAYNAAGESPSNIVQIGQIPTPPAAPSNLVATPQFGPQVSLAWTDNANDETGFVVERSDNGGGFAQIATPAADAVGYLDTTVQPGHTYVYRVYAVSGAGPSGYSNEATAVIPAAPAAPTNLVVTLASSLTSPHRVRVQFRDNAPSGANPVVETGFVLERSDNGGPFAQIATLPPRAGVGNVPAYFDTTVVAGQSYAYRAFTVNGPTPSAPSNTASIIVPPAPAAPSNFLATTQVTGGGTTARVNMIWTDNSNNESRFVIQRATDANFTANLFTSNRGANTTAWANGNLPRGTAFYYRIRSENPYGASVWVNLTPFPITTP